MADLTEYYVVHAYWSIPSDAVAIEHRTKDGRVCLVASSTLARSVADVIDAIEAHEQSGEGH